MKNYRAGHAIITSAIIWGVVIISCALKLRGTPFRESVGLSLTLGVIAHFLFVWVPIGTAGRKRSPKDRDEK